MTRSVPLALLVLLSLGAGLASADELVLTNGGSIKGEILEEGPKEVTIRLPDGNTLTVPRRNLKSVRRSDGSTSPGAATSSRPTKLRWSLKPGEELHYKALGSWTFEVAGGPRLDAPQSESTTDLTLKVLAATVDDYTLEVAIDRVVEVRHENGEQVRKDSKSRNEADQPEGQGLVGVPVTLKLSSRGEILELLTFNKTPMSELEDKDRRGVERMMGENVIRFQLLSLLGTFPEESAKAGKASWKESALLVGPGMGDMTFRVTNTLKSFGGSTATITQAGDVEVPGVQGRKLKSSKVRGQITFKRGRLTRAKQTTFLRHQPDNAKPDYILEITMKTSLQLRR